MLMKKLYRDFMVIAQQQTVNATEAAKLEAEDPIVDTDFPNYGKATTQTPPTSAASSTNLAEEDEEEAASSSEASQGMALFQLKSE